MAVRLESNITRYIGLSTDVKPTLVTPARTIPGTTQIVAAQPAVAAGSSFLETDTGRIARYDGHTWVYQAGDTDLLDKLDLLIDLQTTTNSWLELILSKL